MPSTRDPALIRAFMRLSLGSSTPEDVTRIELFETTEEQMAGRRAWPVLLQRTMTELVDLGINPAGPKASMTRLLVDRNLPWNLAHRPPLEGLWLTLAPELTVHDLDRQRESLATELASSIFDRAGHDVESIGIGWVDAAIGSGSSPIPSHLTAEVVRAVIRILGTARRYAGGNPSSGMPRAVREYLEAVANLQGVNPTDLFDFAETALDQSGVAPGWVLATASADSRLELVVATSAHRWDCPRCSRASPPRGRHMHRYWLQSTPRREPDTSPRCDGLLRLASIATSSSTSCCRANRPNKATLITTRATTPFSRGLAAAS